MKRLLFRVILICSSVVFLLVTIELLMRLTSKRENPAKAVLKERSLDLLAMQPSREHPWSKNCPDPLKIAVIGDSFTYGAGVQTFDRYPFRLEAMLNMNEGVRPAEVCVFAKPGTSTYQQLPLLKQALEWKPQLIILGICLNDTENWREPHKINRWRKEFMPQQPEDSTRNIIRHSYIMKWIYMKNESLHNHRGFIKYYQRLYDPEYMGFKKFVEAIDYMKAKCDTNRVDFVAVIIPLFSCNLDEGKYPFDFVHAQLQTTLSAKSIPNIDLLKYFRGLNPDLLQLIPGVDPHPDELAYQIIAEGILYNLLDKGLVDKSYKPEVRERTIHQLWERVAERMLTPLDMTNSTRESSPTNQ